MPSSFLTLEGVSGIARGRRRLVARGTGDLHLGGFSDSEGTHSNCTQKVRVGGDGMGMASAAAGYGPETVIEDAPGSTADMSIGGMFHERLECCLGLQSEPASVFDSTRSGFEEWIGRDGIGRETAKECSWESDEPRRGRRKRDKR